MSSAELSKCSNWIAAAHDPNNCRRVEVHSTAPDNVPEGPRTVRGCEICAVELVDPNRHAEVVRVAVVKHRGCAPGGELVRTEHHREHRLILLPAGLGCIARRALRAFSTRVGAFFDHHKGQNTIDHLARGNGPGRTGAV